MEKQQDQIFSIFFLTEILPEPQDVQTLCTLCLSKKTNKKKNKDSYLSPVHWFHSSLATWIQQHFGYASSCAPVHKHTQV